MQGGNGLGHGNNLVSKPEHGKGDIHEGGGSCGVPESKWGEEGI